MITSTRFSTLFVVLFILASSFALAIRIENNGWPVSIAPGQSAVVGGNSTTVTVSINQASTTSTTVYLSSSNPLVLQVPSSITIPAGHTSGQALVVTAEPQQDPPIGTKPNLAATVVTVTASGNGRSVNTNITVH